MKMDAEIRAMSAMKRTIRKIVASVPAHERHTILDIGEREINQLRLEANTEIVDDGLVVAAPPQATKGGGR